MIKAIEWLDERVRFLDQSKLPGDEVYLETDQYEIIAQAIRSLQIRGAPLIGIAAAYGVALAAVRARKEALPIASSVEEAISSLRATRPTAVNLAWALHRMKTLDVRGCSAGDACTRYVMEATAIHREDERMCRQIADAGLKLIPPEARILTHCNAGALATGGAGTALGVIVAAHREGKIREVYASETRPALQGSRLTAWELSKGGIDVTLVTDSTAAFLMEQNRIDLVIVGADRIASNGDTANKIGTYSHALAARHHRLPFYVAAPRSTFDPALPDGSCIPIEERSGREMTHCGEMLLAPAGVGTYTPAFDITPASLITAFITERGVIYPPFDFKSL